MAKPELRIDHDKEGFRVFVSGRLLFEHTRQRPMVRLGTGDEAISMYRGNFDIQDIILSRHELTEFSFIADGRILFSDGLSKSLTINLEKHIDHIRLVFENFPEDINRFWIKLSGEPDEKIYGCGEQFSHFNLRGKKFPIWTSEPGVGRNKNTQITKQADAESGAGGDYWTTGFPAPTFVSSRKYYCHLDCSQYMEFDFRNPDFHELHIWGNPGRMDIATADDYPKILADLTEHLGRQPGFPEWVTGGIILGIQGGAEVLDERLRRALDAGVKVSGVWCQDWAGIRMTSFGKRLKWDWSWNQELYPGLDSRIDKLKDEGIRFLSYINPYLASDGEQFAEAADLGYFVKDQTGSVYEIDFGEFMGGTVDLTNPDAREWHKTVIKKNMIDLGCGGWMADFGEYLPADCVLHDGDPLEMHNRWPALWAKLNHEAIAESGKLGEIFFFMRAGFTGTQRHAVSLWAGDQCVDWSLDDGLPSVIPAALSVGMTGCGITHSDIGGYTTLYGLKRNKELFLRWLEMAAFTPIMRTHEGNRPGDNHQFDTDDETLAAVARMSSIHAKLEPYLRLVIEKYVNTGLPAQRPLFVHYPDDKSTYDISYQYMLGPDLLVAPVLKPDVDEWDIYLPPDKWIHLWSGEAFQHGNLTVQAPTGMPPVFYRSTSSFAPLFHMFKEKAQQLMKRSS